MLARLGSSQGEKGYLLHHPVETDEAERERRWPDVVNASGRTDRTAAVRLLRLGDNVLSFPSLCRDELVEDRVLS